MINNEVISNTPTIFIATAMTTAINSISARRKPATGSPSTLASSSCTVIASNGRHNVTSNASTAALPPRIQARSVGLIASKSPNR
ncbi:hypothetical protein D3C76_1736850 [compost metagenome]